MCIYVCIYIYMHIVVALLVQGGDELPEGLDGHSPEPAGHT